MSAASRRVVCCASHRWLNCRSRTPKEKPGAGERIVSAMATTARRWMTPSVRSGGEWDHSDVLVRS